jgi:hypothetical protein
MKIVLFLLSAGMAQAGPTLEETRAALASEQMTVREEATRELWQNGAAALPILEELSKIEDPEVALRADFVRRRLRMGLQPDSPEDLLDLAEALEQATPKKRLSRLIELLDHVEGAPSALILLDHWASHGLDQPDRLVALAQLVTESLLERRGDWEKFFTWDLSPQCRAAIIAEVARQDLPMQSAMIAILGKQDTAEVYRHLQTFTDEISESTRLALARVAVTNREIPLALTLLHEGLAKTSDTTLVRALAFLEKTSGNPAKNHEGPWQTELEVFRVRLEEDYDELSRLNARIERQQILRYENQLLAGSFALPSLQNDDSPLSSVLALKALHESFGNPPRQPDIEALASAILIDWTVLARTLTLLGSPVEAAETLSSNGQVTSAIGLLWRTQHQEKALELAAPYLRELDETEQIKVRITLAKLHLEAGAKEEAAKVFEPLLFLQVRRDDHRRAAIALGMQLFPRDKLLPLAPDLQEDQPYRRASAIGAFLPFPEKVAVTWYEHFLKEQPLQSPASLFTKVETFLQGDLTEARALISEDFRTRTKKLVLPIDSLYQNVLFLRLPESLEMVRKAAWFQLSTHDLARIIEDEAWPLETRKEALKTALLINPIDPALLWHDLRLNQKGASETLLELTLGNPSLVLQLGALTGKRETLKNAAAVANLKDSAALQVLSVLAKSYLENGQADQAARLMQTALCGEVAVGSQPATPVKATLGNLATYFEARATLAEDDPTRAVWNERLRKIR